MKVGYVGLGKLGLPVALATERSGMEVRGVDPDPRVAETLRSRVLPYREAIAPQLLERTEIDLTTVPELVRWADLIFVAVQTPHDPGYGGEVPCPAPKDFSYAYLVAALDELSHALEVQGRSMPVTVISTTAPGTYRNVLERHVSPLMRYAYNPYFIAMGTVIPDFLRPEFILVGSEGSIPELEDFYWSVLPPDDDYASPPRPPVVHTSIVNAELTKMLYNTYISSKIVFANAAMELADAVGGDCDVVSDTLALATKRIISPAYMRGGMGDGGGCHPRDNLVLSYLADRYGLSFDLFGTLMDARQAQTMRLAERFVDEAGDLPLVILGKAFKPGTALVDGSPALLLAYFLRKLPRSLTHWDPYVDLDAPAPIHEPAAYFIATQHPRFAEIPFPAGSVVVDPHRYIPDQAGVRIVRIGAA